MNSADKKHSDNLRSALLALHHSGHNGFEGLLGILLGELTGQSFRLAKSGSQRGRDGDSAFDGGATYFEGKRYKDSPTPPEITAKLLPLVNDDAGQVDLWVLGATCEISSQTETEMRTGCANLGIGSFLLDWNENDLGSLLLVIANAPAKAKDFLSRNLKSKTTPAAIKSALAAIDHFAKHSEFPTRLQALRSALSAEQAGLGYARKRNHDWMSSILSNKVDARFYFGQPLAPRDKTGLEAIGRPIEEKLTRAFTGTPEAEIYAVIGEEGVGKSWLTASAWLASDPASIFLMIPAEDLLAPETTGNFEGFLIGKLIQQTGGQTSPQASKRWTRRIIGWRANPAPKNVRVTVVLDGLNQSLNHDWAKRLDYAAKELAKIGGCLVITTRSAHWRHLKGALISKVAEVRVDRWSVAEVQKILRGRGIDPAKITGDVLESLRNPRILGIAVELFSNNDVQDIEQLSVGRLLFEHMRKAQITGAAPMLGAKFAELLRDLARETLSRAQQQQKDDLRVFDEKNHHGLQEVASSSFFEGVKGSLRYEIKPEGLNLGLALSLVEALETELRNKRDPRERLAVILEPITALDEAANVVFLAIQVACLDEEASPEVRSALIEHFVSLQNLPDSEADAFAVLVQSVPSAFLVATENAHTSNSHVPNAEWLLYALHKHRDDPAVWTELAAAMRRWLAYYSLAPERMMFRKSGRDTEAQVSEERAKRQAKIDGKLNGLTAVEKKYLDDNLAHTDRWNFTSLHRLAFHLLAGKPLEDFGDDLVKWSFSDALGPAINPPDNEFRQLIHFNKVDWKETRDALLRGIEIFEGDNSSSVGKWAMVKVLRAVASSDEAKKAEELADWLTRDREKFEGWSRIEGFCDVDPCDPATTAPYNVSVTAKEYHQIDPSKLALHMGSGSEDHTFHMARTGVVRFHPDDAVVSHRALADDVLKRTDFARRQGVLSLLEHSAALTSHQARELLRSGQMSKVKFDDKKDHRDEWLTAQFSIFTGIAHLNADEQLEAIANVEGDTVMLDALDSLLPASEETAERVLERVLQSPDGGKQSLALAAIRASGTPLSARSCAIVGQLLKSSNSAVRSQALGVAANSGDKNILKQVVDGGWDSRPLRSGEQSYERWYGSAAILEAAKAGLIDLDDALDRMDLNHYGYSARDLGTSAAIAIGKRVEAAIERAIGYAQTGDLPEMHLSAPGSRAAGPSLVSLSDPPPSQDIGDQLSRLSETSEQFDARQDRMAHSFDKFAKELTKADAGLILSDLTLDGMKALVEADEEAGMRWTTMLNHVTDMQFRNLHHVATQLAVTLTKEDGAKKLLGRVLATNPSINRVAGAGKIPVQSIALWRNADKPELRDICKHRLTTCRNDGRIANEVLAATLGGHVQIIEDTIDELLETGQPVDTCLALTVAGFCDESTHASAVLAGFEGTKGYVGIAQKAATEAYNRNVWARHWYEQMRNAANPLVFWQASVLLTKIVDGRYDHWAAEPGAGTSVFASFLPTVEREITRRIEKWQGKRKDKLHGDKAPASLFLPEETMV